MRGKWKRRSVWNGSRIWGKPWDVGEERTLAQSTGRMSRQISYGRETKGVKRLADETDNRGD